MARILLHAEAVPSGLAVLAGGGAAAMARAELEPVLVDLTASWWPPSRAANGLVRLDAARAVRRVLNWLETQPGSDWPTRWQASGADTAGRGWRVLAGMDKPWDSYAAQYSTNALMMLRAVRPRSAWLLSSKRVRLWSDWPRYHDQKVFDRLIRLLADETSCLRTTESVPKHLVRLSISTGRSLSQLTGADFVAEHALLAVVAPRSHSLHPTWHYLHRLGLLPGEPEDLRQVLAARQRTPAELVDQYGVRSPAMRAVLVDYLTERSTSCDYSTLSTLALNLVKLFWVDLEHHHPGISRLALSSEQAAGWRDRVRTQPNGRPRRGWPDVVGSVRTFYGDLAGWAHERPRPVGPVGGSVSVPAAGDPCCLCGPLPATRRGAGAHPRSGAGAPTAGRRSQQPAAPRRNPASCRRCRRIRRGVHCSRAALAHRPGG